MARAYRWIARKPHSAWEIRQRLKPHASEPEIEAVVGKLAEHKLLDDFNFSANYASYRLKEGCLGPARIRSELLERGVVAETIDRALELATQETSEEEAATGSVRNFLRKRYGPMGPKQYRQLINHLLRSGFSSVVIHRVLRQCGLEEIDWSL